ncbi:MAG: polysaccharide biosynthesis/export family protein [Pseudomonadota bacterium]
MIFSSTQKIMRGMAMLGLVTLMGCGLPATGPTKSQLLLSSREKQGDAVVVPVNAEVVRRTNFRQTRSFPSSFYGAPSINTDVIRTGDELILTVYENVETGVLGPAGTPSTITPIQVDNTGHIFIPYAGRIKAGGNTIESVRSQIADALAVQTPDPQVLLARSEGLGSAVTIVGSGVQNGVYPIGVPTTHLTGMLAQAGGSVNANPESTIVSVTRGGRKGSVWLSDILDNRRNDIHLRPGDVVRVDEDIRTYTMSGQIGNGVQKFPKPNLSLFEAVSSAGGISNATGNASGVFVLRSERGEIANLYYSFNDPTVNRNVMYIFDLKAPNGVFNARDFLLRDGDIIYVTEAPYSQFSKAISALITPINSASGLVQAGDQAGL